MTVVGPERWYVGHTLAINYPEVPTEQDRARAFINLWTLITDLPCDVCRNHATEHVKRYPPNMSGSQAYQKWWIQFHNTVNHRLGKPLFTYNEYWQKYAAEIAVAKSLQTPTL